MLRVHAGYLRPDFEETRLYWDSNLERNPLRGHAETPVGGVIAWLIEVAGDIVREYSQEYRDRGYLNEKIVRLQRNLNAANFRGELSPNEVKSIAQIEPVLEGLPAPSPEIEYVKKLISAMLRRELEEAMIHQRGLHNRLRDQRLTLEESKSFEPEDDPDS